MTTRRAVLLDVDGTLVDTNYFHAVAWFRAFRDHGIVVPLTRLHRMIGMGADEIIETLSGRNWPEIEEAWSENFDELKCDIPAFDGARDLIKGLAERDVVVVLATSGRPDDVEYFRSVIDADEWVTAAVNSSEVEDSKPAPDIFRLALERAGVGPAAAVVVGDTVWDVKAAAACNLPCVAVLTGGVSRAELEEAGAAAVAKDVSELASDFDAGPLAPYLGPGPS